MDDAMCASSGTRTAMCWSSTRFSTGQPHPPESEPASVDPRSVLAPSGRRAVTSIATDDRKRRQPGFPPDDPELIGGYQLVRVIQRAEIDLDLVAAAGQDRETKARAEEAAVVFGGGGADADSVRREDRRGMEQCTVELAAVEAVADADAIRQAGGDQPHRSAQTASGESFHQGLPCIWPRHGSVIDAAPGTRQGASAQLDDQGKPPSTIQKPPNSQGERL